MSFEWVCDPCDVIGRGALPECWNCGSLFVVIGVIFLPRRPGARGSASRRIASFVG
jgi:hypothetical protein